MDKEKTIFEKHVYVNAKFLSPPPLSLFARAADIAPLRLNRHMTKVKWRQHFRPLSWRTETEYLSMPATLSLFILVFLQDQGTSMVHAKHIHLEFVITVILPFLARVGQSVPGRQSAIALCVAASSIRNLAFRCLINCH